MAIPANLELAAHGERRRTSLARLYLEHERLVIGGGTLVAVLLLWEALGRSGLVDPLFHLLPHSGRAGRLAIEPRSRLLVRR
jgi:hypothetical protein